MPNQPTLGLRLDPADPEYSSLTSAASRIAKLLDVADTRQDQFLGATLDLFLGAIYALVLSKHAGYEHRAGSAEPDKIIVRAHDVQAGWIRTDGKWIAGFHFNSGILRIAAVYHRALKIALDKPTSRAHAQVLRPAAKARYRTWTDT